MYAQFDPFFAPFWSVSPSTFYRVIRFSRSGASVYIEAGGRTKMVPIEVIEIVRLGKVID